MGNDEGQGIVSITGVEEGNSTLSCVTSYGSKATLQVICAWDEEFTINKTKLQGTPDKSYEIKFTVNPTDCQIEVDDDCKVADITVENNGDGTGIVTVVPTGEGRETINLIATNPTTKKQLPIRTVNLDFKYDQITVVPSVISKDGSFSRYDANSGILIIGDGETLNLGFGVEEKGVDYSITNVSIMPTDSSRLITVAQNGNSSQNGQLSSLYSVKHTQDTKDYQYRIVTGYVPQYYTGEYSFAESSLQNGVWQDASLSKFKWHSETDSFREYFEDYQSEYVYLGYEGVTAFYINANTWDPLSAFNSNKHVLVWSDNGDNGNQGAYFSRRREPSLDGKIMSVSEFESKAWYYCPGVSCEGVSAPKGILSQHIDAVKEVSTSTDVKSTKQTDILNVTIRRTFSDKTTSDKTFSIPIYTETRGCVYNYK